MTMAEPQTGTPQENTGEKSRDELSKEELDKATGGAKEPTVLKDENLGHVDLPKQTIT
jgi:hypothetical protein